MESTRYIGKYRAFVPRVRYTGLALDLLLRKEFSLDYGKACIVSETANRIWKEDAWAAYCLKVVAAKSFERLIYRGGTTPNPNWTMIIQAAYAYSKAAKNAYLFYELRSAAVRCRMLAHRLFCDALPLCRDEEGKRAIQSNIEYETNQLITCFENFSLDDLRFYEPGEPRIPASKLFVNERK